MTVVLSTARAEKITPRWPSRADSRARFEKLMEAVGGLLATFGPSEITIQAIAEAAKMPTATVYHFFPSAEAALVAQARIYIERFDAMAREDTPPEERTAWPHAWRCATERGRDVYTSDVACMRLLLGADVPRDVQMVDSDFNVRLGRIISTKIERETFLEPMAGFAEACTNAIEINDTFWRMSFQRTGTITEAYFEESLRAVLAYMRTYLPDDLKYR